MALVLLSAFGCAGQAWKQAVREDTPAAYYRFMRDYSDSEFVDVARERLEFHKLKRSPSLAGFDQFRKKYPNSELIEALHPTLEKPAFEAALAQGTASAYRSFLDGFPSGSLAARAEGNAVYVEADGFGGRVAGLERFAMNHPESDFAAEAERTASATATRGAQQFDRVGLVLELAPSTPEAKRVSQALLDRIEKMTDRLGVQVVRVPRSLDPAQAARYPQARLEVSHRETEVQPEVNAGGLERPSVVGVTRVVFREKQGGAIIAEREFSLRVVDKAHVPGTSVLFSAAAPKFWDEFFVPMARWRNDQTIRPPIELGAPVVDVDAVGDRSIVLFENGDFDVIGLADPTQPVKLGSYRRGENYKRWTGVKMLGPHVAIYKGMQIVDRNSGELRQVMRRVIQGVDAAGQALVFADGETVYISSLALLAENRVIAQMKLGRTFGPKNVRVHESAAIVTGPGGALIIDVKNPQAPKAISKLSTREVGEIFDATRIRGRTFLIGARGALLLNRQLSRVEETIDVGKRHRVAVMGRHLVTANASGLQVVDAAPWAHQGTPAAASTSSPDSLLNGSGF
jgi:hypothetical protein